MKRISLGLSLILIFTAGCANLERSNQSGYRGQTYTKTKDTNSAEKIQEQQYVVQLGLDPQNQGKDLQSLAQTRVLLRQRERSLNNAREKAQYYKYGSLLKDDQERLDFLELGNYEAKQAYLRSMNVGARNQTPPPSIQKAIDNQDITLDMTQEWVRQSWGDPVKVDIAGDPAFKNERWRYIYQQATPDGFRQEKRTVYFEGGRVVGWDAE